MRSRNALLLAACAARAAALAPLPLPRLGVAVADPSAWKLSIPSSLQRDIAVAGLGDTRWRRPDALPLRNASGLVVVCRSEADAAAAAALMRTADAALLRERRRYMNTRTFWKSRKRGRAQRAILAAFEGKTELERGAAREILEATARPDGAADLLTSAAQMGLFAATPLAYLTTKAAGDGVRSRAAAEGATVLSEVDRGSLDEFEEESFLAMARWLEEQGGGAA